MKQYNWYTGNVLIVLVIRLRQHLWWPLEDSVVHALSANVDDVIMNDFIVDDVIMKSAEQKLDLFAFYVLLCNFS